MLLSGILTKNLYSLYLFILFNMSMRQETANYHYAIVSRLPESYLKSPRINPNSPPVDLGLAYRQHNDYIELLRKLGIDVLELPPEERHPDAVFVADIAVVINGTALICKPSDRRQGETSIVRSTLRNDLGLRIVEVDDVDAKLYGSDVLFTGQEIVVGIERHTNMKGAQCVAKAFPEYAVTVIHLPDNIQHLRDVMTMAGPDVLVVARGANTVLQELIRRATFSYRVIRVDEEAAANVIYANHVLVHLDEPAIPDSFPIWEAKFDNRLFMDISELRKAGAGLTSLVVLISKPSNFSKHFQTYLDKGHHDLQ